MLRATVGAVQDALANLVDDLLAAAVAALEPPNTEAGAPARQFTSHTEPSEDCSQIAAFWRPVTALPQGVPCVYVPVAPLVVELHRCVTAFTDRNGNPKIPDPAVLSEEARSLAIDGWALYKGILGQCSAGTLFPGVNCRNVTVGALEPIPPTGSMAGVRLTVNVKVSAPAATGS